MLSCHFFNFFMKNHLLSCPYSVKKHQFCQNYIIGWAKKVNRMPIFFPISHEKITALMPIFCQKNVHSLKNTILPCPYFVKKRPFSQNHCALMSLFFQIFHEKPPALMPIFGQKNVHSVKTTPYYGPRKSIVWTEPIFCRKNVHSLKKTVLLCQLKKNHEKPPAVMPIFDKKTSILSKQHYIMSQKSQ